jgi:DNA-binding PadR family transcriptional regulator
VSVQSGFVALLTLGPAYGSQLQAEFLARAAHRKQLNAGQVYSTLDRLTAQGLVRAAGTTSDGLPLYDLTDSGYAQARTWLTAGPTDGSTDWDEMLDQVLLSASIDGALPLQVIAGYRAAFEQLISSLLADGAPQAVSERTAAIASASRASEFGARAALSWLAEIGAQLEQTPVRYIQPRSAERPRRGRRPQEKSVDK